MRTIKIGIVVVLAVAILLVMVLNLQEGVGLLSRQIRFHALVDHSQGLKVGGPVRMNGVDVGNVHNIDIAAGTAGVEIEFTMKADAASHLREDASVAIRPMGLLGDKFLEVVPGTPSKPPLPPGSTLAGKAEGDIGALASSAGATMEHVNAALGDIQRILLALSRGEAPRADCCMTPPSMTNPSA